VHMQNFSIGQILVKLQAPTMAQPSKLPFLP